MRSAHRQVGRLVAVLLGCLLSVVGLLGCGSGGGPPVTSATTPGPGGATVDVSAAAGVGVSLVEQVRTDVTDAVRHVRTVWDGPWAARVEVSVLRDGAAVAAQAAGLSVGAGQADQLAAVAVVPVAGADARADADADARADGRGDAGAGEVPAPVGDDQGRPHGRLLVNAEMFARLSDVGGQVVTRHEVAHLASAAATPPDLPTWLVEGFADAVARSGLADDPASGAVELAAEVQAGRVPLSLPADEAFAGADGRLAQTYQQAWLACRLVVERVGLDGLVRLYREAGTAPAGTAPAGTEPQGRLDGALRDVLGLDLGEFTLAWRTYLQRLLNHRPVA